VPPRSYVSVTERATGCGTAVGGLENPDASVGSKLTLLFLMLPAALVAPLRAREMLAPGLVKRAREARSLSLDLGAVGHRDDLVHVSARIGEVGAALGPIHIELAIPAGFGPTAE
jgi:hypothetical protein